MSDFASTSATELRKMLVDSGKYSQEQADALKGKSKLVEAVLQLNAESNDSQEDIFTSLLKTLEPPSQTFGIEENTENNNIPDYNSVEWHDYVMSQLSDDEKDGDYPTLYGLRRVAELLLGPIIESGPVSVNAPQSEESPGRATCAYTIVFDWNGSGQERRFSSLGGSYKGNTDLAYAIFPEAIAEARAEARTLRKALKLKTMAAEEAPKTKIQVTESVSTGEWKESDKLTMSQELFIKQKCKEMNISLDKLVNKVHAGRELSSLTRGEGKSLIELLKNCQESNEVSEDIKNF
jgi:hypothetical protein